MKVTLYIEGAARNQKYSSELTRRCREGFNKLFERAGFKGRLPTCRPFGGRDQTYSAFAIAHRQAKEGEFVALLVDSEEPVADPEKPWEHLGVRDQWARPKQATDEQVLLMTTCMETWVVTDRTALQKHYKKLRLNSLLSIHGMEGRNRNAVLMALEAATRECSNVYQKGKRSFVILGELDPATLCERLPSFARLVRILSERL